MAGRFLDISLLVLVLILMPRLRKSVAVAETVASLINQSLFSKKQIGVVQKISPSKDLRLQNSKTVAHGPRGMFS